VSRLFAKGCTATAAHLGENAFRLVHGRRFALGDTLHHAVNAVNLCGHFLHLRGVHGRRARLRYQANRSSKAVLVNATKRAEKVTQMDDEQRSLPTKEVSMQAHVFHSLLLMFRRFRRSRSWRESSSRFLPIGFGLIWFVVARTSLRSLQQRVYISRGSDVHFRGTVMEANSYRARKSWHAVVPSS
jgi:hypothetical protein